MTIEDQVAQGSTANRRHCRHDCYAEQVEPSVNTSKRTANRKNCDASQIQNV
jgi:hypothetical protein